MPATLAATLAAGETAPAAGETALAARPLRKDAARNRELLLVAAEDVFSELGLDAGVEEVARRAGVGMGTLYRRFPTKDALVNELAHHLLERITLAASDAAARTDGAAAEAFLTEVGEMFARHGGLLCRLWAVPARAAEISNLRAAMARMVAQDQAAGALRPDVSAADLSLALWGLQGIVETAGTASPDAWRRHIDLLLAGMSAAPRLLTTTAVSRHELDLISTRRGSR